MEKYYTTFEDRLIKLRNRGMTIPSEQNMIIKKYNYYNLINGYKEPFLLHKNNYPHFADPNEDFYKRGTEPKHIEALYNFDEKLRLIFLERLLKIENKLKDVIVQSFYEINDNNNLLHRESEYLKREHYNLMKSDSYFVTEKSGYRYTVLTYINKDSTMIKKPQKYIDDRDNIYYTLITNIYRHIGQQRRKKKSIESYLDKHTYLPLWVLTNILTFGNISKYFVILNRDVQLKVLEKLEVNSVNLNDELDILNFGRVLHILSLFRNVCAHNERFYCEEIYTPIDDDFMDYNLKIPYYNYVSNLKGTPNYLHRDKLDKMTNIKSHLYTLMFSISLFLDENELECFKNDIEEEIETLRVSIQRSSFDKVLKLMGLSFDWYSYLTK